MKLSINTSLAQISESQHLVILVDSENTHAVKSNYQINNLDSLTEAAQFKAGFNESLSLLGQIENQPNSILLGLGNAQEVKAAKLAKIAQTIIKASQKKFKQISVDISALPNELHYLFALKLTQSAY